MWASGDLSLVDWVAKAVQVSFSRQLLVLTSSAVLLMFATCPVVRVVSTLVVRVPVVDGLLGMFVRALGRKLRRLSAVRTATAATR